MTRLPDGYAIQRMTGNGWESYRWVHKDASGVVMGPVRSDEENARRDAVRDHEERTNR